MKDENLSLTDQVAATLSQELMSGKYLDGTRFPNELESVARFGVSRVTIRRAYDILTRRGILVRRPRVGTVVNTQFKAASEPIGQLGAVLPLSNSFAREFLDALNHEAAQEESLITLPPPFTDGASQSTSAMGLAMRGIRNMVVWGMDQTLDLSVFNRLRLLGCNLVFFDHIRLPDAADFVGLDNRHAIRLLLKESLKNGCKKVVFVGISGLEVYSNQEREIAFEDFSRQNHLPSQKINYSYNQFHLGKEDDVCAAELQTISSPEETALLCVNDTVAKLIWRQTRLRFQYYAICTEPCDSVPNIHCIRQPMEKMAQLCVESLRCQKQLGAAWTARDCIVKGIPCTP